MRSAPRRPRVAVQSGATPFTCGRVVDAADTETCGRAIEDSEEGVLEAIDMVTVDRPEIVIVVADATGSVTVVVMPLTIEVFQSVCCVALQGDAPQHYTACTHPNRGCLKRKKMNLLQ